MGWALVILGGVIEPFWVSGLKYSASFIGYFLTAIGIVLSFICMILATKRIKVSIAYAVFVGIGAAGVVIAEIFVFNKPTSLLEIILIATLLFSIIGLKLASKDSDKQDSKAIKNIEESLGLDEISLGGKQ
ncbi:MAG: multidrug efflux SMR transporter [Helicobacteraceae bacterium]|nr:multidrug efflux SMR transporter [Helicobacteraceae bacterium]